MTATTLSKSSLTIYRLYNPLEGTLIRCKKIPDSDLESQLQAFIEQHLQEMFGLKLVKSEFRLESGQKSPRPDTLAFSEDDNCFVVIEYKKNERIDGPVQLLTYANAKTNMEHQRRMLEEYNKNFELSRLTKNVTWENFYCIYIAFDVSTELISRMNLVNADIRFYELHMWEGVVVLHRVGITESSKDDGLNEVLDTTAKAQPKSTPTLTKPEPTPISSDAIPILNLNATYASLTPDTLLFPNGKKYDSLNNWRTVMRKIAHWLFDNQYLKNATPGRPLYSEIPRRPDGSKYVSEHLSTNLYILLQYNNKDMLRYIQKLLKNVDYKPSEFKVTFRQ